MVPLLDQLRETERELALRRSCYPRWVREGKISQAKADHQLRLQEAIVATVRKVWELEQVSLEIRGEFE